MPTSVTTEDEDISDELRKVLTKKGIEIFTNAKIDLTSIERNSSDLTIQVDIQGDVKAFTSEKLLLSVGRVANVEGRMKSALYVASVARTYRMAIDDYFEDPEKYYSRIEFYKNEISKCTYREYTTGFFFGKPDSSAQIYDAL